MTNQNPPPPPGPWGPYGPPQGGQWPPQQQGGWGPPQGQPPQGWGAGPQGQPQGGPWQQQGYPPGYAPQHPGMYGNPYEAQPQPLAVRHGTQDGKVFNAQQSQFFTKVFGWMTMGLGLTAAVSWFTFSSGLWITLAPLFLPLMLVELGLVWWLSARIDKMKATTAIGAFLGYSALNGLSLSVIFAIYALGSIAVTFLATTMMFGFLFVIGATTKKDLSGMGGFLTMGLVGLIVASLVNMLASMFGWFPAVNQALYWGITYLGVLIFAGLTVYDAQYLKALSAQGFHSEEIEQKASVIGALKLYLDFINLFLFLLRIFGRRD